MISIPVASEPLATGIEHFTGLASGFLTTLSTTVIVPDFLIAFCLSAATPRHARSVRNRHLVESAELDLADRRDMPAISGQHSPLRYLVPHANFPNARHSTLDFAVDRTKVAAIQSLSIHGTPVAVPAEPNFLERSDVIDGFGISGWNATDKLALARVRGLGVPAAAVRHRRKKVNKDSPSQRHTLEKIVVRKSVVGHIKWSVRMVNDALANFKPRKP